MPETVDLDIDEIEVSGISSDGQFPSRIASFSETNGNAGSVTIDSDNLQMSDRGEISVSGDGGDAGTLLVTANSISLEDGGSLEAEVAGGDRGDIGLNSNSLILRNSSRIATNATVDATGGDITINTDNLVQNNSNITTNAENATGGNIFIDSDILVGTDNSDITANAGEGAGGRVTIHTQGLFGLEFRDEITPESDITATSSLGSSFDGEVIINTPGIDATSGLVELPERPIDAEAQLANNLCALKDDKIAGGSEFIITGKGGLPPGSDDHLFNAYRVVDWANRSDDLSNTGVETKQTLPPTQENQPTVLQENPLLIEAQGWVVNPDGTITLTAEPFNGTPVSPPLTHPHCNLPH